ncbi:MAG: hypothetical protein AB7L13_08175 [Acidimicrobiia bacterium]
MVDASLAKALLVISCDAVAAKHLASADIRSFRTDDPEVRAALSNLVSHLRSTSGRKQLDGRTIEGLLFGWDEGREDGGHPDSDPKKSSIE